MLIFLPRRKHEGPSLSSTDLLGDGSGCKASEWLSCSFVNEHKQCSVTDEPVIDLGGGGRLDHLTK